MPLIPFTLPPAIAMVMFAAGVIAGVQYRRVWKNEGPRLQLWIFGLVAAFCLLTVALVPLSQ